MFVQLSVVLRHTVQFFQGIARPVNDLPVVAPLTTLLALVAITAVQAQMADNN